MIKIIKFFTIFLLMNFTAACVYSKKPARPPEFIKRVKTGAPSIFGTPEIFGTAEQIAEDTCKENKFKGVEYFKERKSLSEVKFNKKAENGSITYFPHRINITDVLIWCLYSK